MSPYRIPRPALISFSGGRTSGFMLKHIVDAHGGTLPDNIHVVFANTGKEMPETLDFVQECAERWGVRITWVELDYSEPNSTKVVNHNSASRDGAPFQALIEKRGYLPNAVARFCTQDLKVRRMKWYMHGELGYARWTNVIGLRADEPRRVERLTRPTRDRWVSIAPLAVAGVTKTTVQEWWAQQQFDLALPNSNGVTPLGNCDLCFLKKEGTLKQIIKERPELAEWWIEAEKCPAKASGDGGRFRKGRASYQELVADSVLCRMPPDFLEDGESFDCACTD